MPQKYLSMENNVDKRLRIKVIMINFGNCKKKSGSSVFGHIDQLFSWIITLGSWNGIKNI